jgi:GNAT superfamily N-acetyltransferase
VADIDALRRRVDAFETDLFERTSTLVEPSAFGTAFLNLDFSQRYSSNFLWIRRDLDGIDADSIAADADRTLGEHDLHHRHVEIRDDGNGPRLAAAFLELGWSVEALIHMVQLREPEVRPTVEVIEADFATARPTIEATLRAQPYADSEEVVRQLTDWRSVLEREVGARFFLGVAEGEPVAVCESYVLGDVGQVEDVNTLEAYRGRGLASAVVLAASAGARARGADLVFLTAAEDDWPKELYSRLGFDRVARFWEFTRAPS